MRNEKFHKAIHNEYVPTVGETIKMIDMWLNFKNSQHCSNVNGKTIQEVLDDVAQLVAKGVREITLLGQNVNSFGKGNLNSAGRAPLELHNVIGKVGPRADRQDRSRMPPRMREDRMGLLGLRGGCRRPPVHPILGRGITHARQHAQAAIRSN